MKAVPVHPMAGVGGYQMPRAGRIGGAKGVGYANNLDGAQQLSAVNNTKARASSGDTVKRKRDQDQGKKMEKPVSKEEAEFLARREAARQRVQARTMATFGLG
jgi:WW domain-binding protein 4